MNKVGVLFLFMSSSVLFSQSAKSPLQTVKFEDTSLDLNFSPFKVNGLTYDFSKRDTPFSLYHPMPGLNVMSLNSRYYYSMDNTSRLLGIEMKEYEKEPIFPDVKKTTLGEAVFFQVMNSLFDK
ncbi:hypothetical protein [Flavobacterium sp.]|uniref:hypothetical protein n=1 Tax=Flavobacterium sp. TaxID=239 RepID=UPI00261BAB1D|nr:hypothetical protein [Flavobacterium sp.]MDG2433912.1 hypothetical protein [Flavobacterium sp.]